MSSEPVVVAHFLLTYVRCSLNGSLLSIVTSKFLIECFDVILCSPRVMVMYSIVFLLLTNTTSTVLPMYCLHIAACMFAYSFISFSHKLMLLVVYLYNKLVACSCWYSFCLLFVFNVKRWHTAFILVTIFFFYFHHLFILAVIIRKLCAVNWICLS